VHRLRMFGHHEGRVDTILTSFDRYAKLITIRRE
jgi:hypothetical protein